MIHIDKNEGTGILNGSMLVLLDEFSNIARGLYTSMADDMGDKLAKKMLSGVFENAIAEKNR